MTERATLPAAVTIAAASTAVLLATFVLSGAVADALGTGVAAAGDSRVFSADEPDLVLLDSTEAESALGTSITLETEVSDWVGEDESQIEPAGCGILFYGPFIRASGVSSRSGTVDVVGDTLYLGQTASYFDDAVAARAVMDDVATALRTCAGEAVHHRDGNWSAVYEDATVDTGFTPDSATLVVHYDHGSEHSWRLYSLAGNVIVDTSVFFAPDDPEIEWVDTVHGADWFRAAADKLAR